MKKIITIFFFLPMLCFGQKQGTIWYFGGTYSPLSPQGAGLDFNSTSPTALTNSAMPYTEGNATYCNSVGQLIFYASGDTVYDRTHNVMANGGGLKGHWSTAQSTLIVPVTGDTNKFYIFNNDGKPTSNGTGLHYSIIDMQQNGGLGAVTTIKAQNLISKTGEQLTGCQHSNGRDFWVITTDYDSSIFYAFLVTPDAVLPPVITDLGFNLNLIGGIEISPNADKIAVRTLHSNRYLRTLIDFNNATGVFSNPYYLLTSNGFNTACGFSPDGNLFYDILTNNNRDSIYQYDLNASNIMTSRILIFNRPTKPQIDTRNAPNGKMYFGGDQTSPFLDVINSPNVVGTGCNFQQNAVSLAGMGSGLILPNELLIANNFATHTVNYDTNALINVYPNPTITELTIETNQASFSNDDKLQILSVTGQKVYSAPIRSNKTSVIFTNYPKGIYIVITHISGLKRTFKILKE